MGPDDTTNRPSDRPVPRERYGFERTTCACEFCTSFCRLAPGRLDMADLDQLCPPGQDLYAWAGEHLRAVTDQPYPKLVPARRENGHCHWLLDGRCLVHEHAPFGCAFFDSHMNGEEMQRRSRAISQACWDDARTEGIYFRVWRYLCDRGLTAVSGNRDAIIAERDRIRRDLQRS